MCAVLAKAAKVELSEHRVRGAGDDLVRQEFASDQPERCTAVSEGNVETVHMINAAEHGSPSPGIGFGPMPYDAARAQACLAGPGMPRRAATR